MGMGPSLMTATQTDLTQVGLTSLANKMIIKFSWVLVRRPVSNAKEHPSDLEIFEQ